MNKQTAAEWLEQEFIALQNYGINELGLFAKAKAMEKEQIIDAVNLPKEERWYDAKLYNSSGEQYYNENYGQNRD